MRLASERRSIATVRDIVTTMMPSYPELGRDARDQISSALTRYVTNQIAAMPTFLRIPYSVALLAFELLPLARYGRRFGRLQPDARAAYVAWWSDSPVSAMRDFVKLIRSTSLLVFFDHPLVRAQLDRERRTGSRGGTDGVDG